MKKYLKLMSLICIMIVSSIYFVGCSCKVSLNIEFFLFHVDLNGGKFTEEFKKENNISKKSNYMLDLNLNYYEGAANAFERVAKGTIAPEGKIFAGWYFDKNCSDGKEVNKRTFSAIEKTDDHVSETIHARWIDIDSEVIILDLNHDEADFTSAYKTSKNISGDTKTVSTLIKTNDVQSFINNLPTKDDVVAPVDKVFDGWGFETYYGSNRVTEEALNNKINERENGYIYLYGKWEERPTGYYTFALDLQYREQVGLITATLMYTEEAKQRYGGTFLVDYQQQTNKYLDEDFSNVLNALPTIDDLIVMEYDVATDDFIYFAASTKYNLKKWVIYIIEDGQNVYTKELTKDNVDSLITDTGHAWITLIPVIEEKN